MWKAKDEVCGSATYSTMKTSVSLLTIFYTKPTGEGTGLGLSLSYDIITKGHGGNLSVTSQQEKGTELVVNHPG